MHDYKYKLFNADASRRIWYLKGVCVWLWHNNKICGYIQSLLFSLQSLISYKQWMNLYICNLTIILYTKFFVLRWIIKLLSWVPIVSTIVYQKKPDFVQLYLKNKTIINKFFLNNLFSRLVCSCCSYILVLQWSC
jgi:hypothetical protein